MAHTPLKMTIPEAQIELDNAWKTSYSPKRNEEVIDLLDGRGLDARIMHFVMRLFFRGIYIPQMNKRTWAKLIAQNRKPIIKLVRKGVGKYRESRRKVFGDVRKVPTAKLVIGFFFCLVRRKGGNFHSLLFTYYFLLIT